MSLLDDAKALVAQHIAASQNVLGLLDQLTANEAGATQTAVAAATGDLTAANEALSAQLSASIAQLNQAYAKIGGAPAPAEAPAALQAAAAAPAAAPVL
jgi:hypothetical protein